MADVRNCPDCGARWDTETSEHTCTPRVQDALPEESMEEDEEETEDE
jgi:hypothetical protein